MERQREKERDGARKGQRDRVKQQEMDGERNVRKKYGETERDGARKGQRDTVKQQEMDGERKREM